jgi:hypothetical protein
MGFFYCGFLNFLLITTAGTFTSGLKAVFLIGFDADPDPTFHFVADPDSTTSLYMLENQK